MLSKLGVEAVAHREQVIELGARDQRRDRSGAARIFPFRLARQAIGLSFLLAEPAAEGVRVVPGDDDHRVGILLVKSRLPPTRITDDAQIAMRIKGTRLPSVTLRFGLVSSSGDELGELTAGHFTGIHVEGT